MNKYYWTEKVRKFLNLFVSNNFTGIWTKTVGVKNGIILFMKIMYSIKNNSTIRIIIYLEKR